MESSSTVLIQVFGQSPVPSPAGRQPQNSDRVQCCPVLLHSTPPESTAAPPAVWHAVCSTCNGLYYSIRQGERKTDALAMQQSYQRSERQASRPVKVWQLSVVRGVKCCQDPPCRPDNSRCSTPLELPSVCTQSRYLATDPPTRIIGEAPRMQASSSTQHEPYVSHLCASLCWHHVFGNLLEGKQMYKARMQKLPLACSSCDLRKRCNRGAHAFSLLLRRCSSSPRPACMQSNVHMRQLLTYACATTIVSLSSDSCVQLHHRACRCARQLDKRTIASSHACLRNLSSD